MESRERLLWSCVPLLQRVVARNLLRHGHTELDALSLTMAEAYPSLPRGSGSSSFSPEMSFYLWQRVRPAWIPGASLHGSGVLSASQASPTHRGAAFQLWEISHTLFSFASDVPHLPWW